MKILDGRKVRDRIAKKIQADLKKLHVKPALAIIQVGDNASSNAYIEQKKIFGEKIGFKVSHIRFDAKTTENVLFSKIHVLNADKRINGIIIQLPLPKNLDKQKILETISPEKDVDGLNSKNLSRLMTHADGGFVPATTKGILSLLDYYKIPIEGKKVTVVGRSQLVGAPTALAFLNRNATVTVCHRKTKNLKDEVKKADIVVVAAGHPKLIKKDFVKKGQIIIDVGITRIGKDIFGDVDFKSVSKIVKAISPVPGGVGPMTVVSLFENILTAYRRQHEK
ncbi:MAG: bifunctional 5,10-methylenetetrahydrofolate dehydrogenase/5,10-methenyltetrahydrofolate cyclohydrolase [Bacteroidia bacterium]